MITVKAYAGLASYLVNKTGKYTAIFDNKNQKTSISTILNHYNIPSEKAAIILINGKIGDSESEVSNGDTVTFFSPVGGG